MSDTKSYSSLTQDTSGYVGFANLPNQVHRKSVKKGFEFTLMVAGKNFPKIVDTIRVPNLALVCGGSLSCSVALKNSLKS